jgi:hypothetical protein
MEAEPREMCVRGTRWKATWVYRQPLRNRGKSRKNEAIMRMSHHDHRRKYRGSLGAWQR